MENRETQMSVSDEHQLFLNETAALSRKELKPLRAKLSSDEFIPEAVGILVESGLTGLLIEERFGGCGGDALCVSLAMEELGAVDSGLAGSLAFHYLCCAAVQNRNPLFQKVLGELSHGEALGALAYTEPGAGSNPGDIACSALKYENKWLLNGNKCFVCNVETVASTYILALAREVPEGELTCFLIPYPGEGISPIHRYVYMGWDTIHSWAMALADCRVSEDMIVGGTAHGLETLKPAVSWGRLAIASGALGLSRSCYDVSLEYARERRQFSRPIMGFQAILFHLADMALRIEVGRTSLWKVAVSGELPPDKVDMLYLYCGESAEFCSSTALEIHGGLGYTVEGPTARLYRDAKGFRLAMGTPDLVKLSIAGSL